MAGVNAGSLAIGILIAIAPVLLFVQVVIHELVLMALLARLRVLRVKLGPLLVRFADRRIHFQFDWSLNQPIGYVAAVPLDDHAIRSRMMVFIGGGPLASLSVGFLFLLLASVLNQPSESFSSTSGPRRNAFFFPQNLWRPASTLLVSAVWR
jgi:hypothetical protein